MLWSSSGIREAKTEIGSAQPRWSKKLGGLRYIGWIRLGRLRIAMGIAKVVAYLHTAFSRLVVHRDVRSAIIILDENNVAKLIDFSLSISIPKGEQHVEDAVRGRTGIGAPEHRLIEIVDPMLLNEGINQEQFLAFAQIALSCISDIAEDRPTMIDVAKQLRKIYESISHSHLLSLS
ncbi:hypothetical protein RGQ29_003888 [Quercus rubra]|uniref:Protein kinase domain-containing protein n=1 Tax=Quercus rubra TaxID=3512 RepID=A0AAN7EE65_QUERU|nr:hypothetical protein RGQ29_003888 [Quercus rubra]